MIVGPSCCIKFYCILINTYKIKASQGFRLTLYYYFKFSVLELLRILLYDKFFIANISLFGSSDPDPVQIFPLNFKLCFHCELGTGTVPIYISNGFGIKKWDKRDDRPYLGTTFATCFWMEFLNMIYNQCGGSGLLIPDLNVSILHPGSRVEKIPDPDPDPHQTI